MSSSRQQCINLTPDDLKFQSQKHNHISELSAYEVVEMETGKLVLTAYSKYSGTRNDVKTAKFSDDSKGLQGLITTCTMDPTRGLEWSTLGSSQFRQSGVV
jgi:hypothetical protein